LCSFLVCSEEYDIDTTDYVIGQKHTESWVTDNWRHLEEARWIEIFVIFHYSLACDNIGFFLESERIFPDFE
jgi:hypothetical protein